MVCAGLLVGACSKEKAPFDPDAGGVNEITPDVAAPSPDAIAPDPDSGRDDADMDEPPCDGLEPNDSVQQASDALEADGPVESRICQGDEDWFGIDVGVGDVLRIDLTFLHQDGDLDMALFDAAAREVEVSESTDNNESLEWTVERAGTHFIKVYGYEDAANAYALSAAVELAPVPCQDDALEDNDTLHQAHQLLPPESFNGAICQGDEDFYTVFLEPGWALVVRLGFEHALGDLDMQLVGPDGEVVARAESSDDDESLRFEAAEEGLHTLRVRGYTNAQAPYRLDVSLSGAPQPPPHTLSGQITFDDPFLDGDEYDYISSALAGATVEVLNEDTGEVLGNGVTDGRGRWRVRYDGAGAQRVYARVLARHRAPEGRVDVVDAQRRVYAVRSSGSVEPGDDGVLDMVLLESLDLSDPFNTLDAVNVALSWWSTQFTVRNVPLLHVMWVDGQSLECGTCYRQDEVDTVYLYGLRSDNDALDDPVILHEVGHFIMNAFSKDDSPGGAHDGTPVDPLLAYAEGWATAFAAMVRDDSVYYDTLGGGVIVHDLETPDEDYSRFTGGSVRAPISEYLVASLMWDFFDDRNDGDDRISAGVGAVLPVIDYLDQGQRAVRGVDGVDLVDYLDGAHCVELAPEGDISARLLEADFPYESSPQSCQKPGAPFSGALVDGQLVMHTRRPLDGVTAHRCDEGGCVLVGEFGKFGADAQVSWAVERDDPRQWFVLRGWRGGLRWATSVGDGDVARGADWRPGPMASDGSPVVQAWAKP